MSGEVMNKKVFKRLRLVAGALVVGGGFGLNLSSGVVYAGYGGSFIEPTEVAESVELQKLKNDIGNIASRFVESERRVREQEKAVDKLEMKAHERIEKDRQISGTKEEIGKQLTNIIKKGRRNVSVEDMDILIGAKRKKQMLTKPYLCEFEEAKAIDEEKRLETIALAKKLVKKLVYAKSMFGNKGQQIFDETLGTFENLEKSKVLRDGSKDMVHYYFEEEYRNNFGCYPEEK
ncbi:hypothetical protein FACS1894152_3280 [Bacilli bacterium]|nr:hypothetical protein FACS1894152_3280 [Bacilli bacterium]